MVNRGPESQTNVEMYADAIDAKFGADFHIPERFHSQLMAVTFGMDGSADAALEKNTIRLTERIILNPFAAKRNIQTD